MISEFSSDTASQVESVGEAVEVILTRFLTTKQASEAEMVALPNLIDMLGGLLKSGKKMRPVLCAAGWYAGGGKGAIPESTKVVAASLEMFHAFALIHDDVMDRSATRRGRPTLHQQIFKGGHFHRDSKESLWLSNCAAILVGNLALCWAFEILHSAQLSSTQRAGIHHIIDSMSTEAIYGQYLDLEGSGNWNLEIEELLTTIRYKTAKYTVERPLHAGAILAGAGHSSIEALSEFALPLGEAFQLRDDLLDIYGDPSITGKSTLDDIRECRNTVLMKIALDLADIDQKNKLLELSGSKYLDSEGVDFIRHILSKTGAQKLVEEMIFERYRIAIDSLESASFPQETTSILKSLAQTALWRKY